MAALSTLSLLIRSPAFLPSSLSLPLSLSKRRPCFWINFQLPLQSINKKGSRHLSLLLCATHQESNTPEPEPEPKSSEKTLESNVTTLKTRLYVTNLPWTCTSEDIKNLFQQCGEVIDVELMKFKAGRNRGMAFVMMSSEDEALAALVKLNSYEFGGRTIKAELAKKAKKISPSVSSKKISPPVGTVETRHKVYVGNLDWRVRSSDLREFFTKHSNGLSARVVYGGTKGKPAGYGFVSFASKEDAEAAVATLEGKELNGRSLRLRIARDVPSDSGDNAKEDEGASEGISDVENLPNDGVDNEIQLTEASK
ncbi:hypothetical protein AMTRI_Chr04g183180 [Amborella trichopoda]